MSSPSVARWKSGSICSRTVASGVDVDDDAVEHRHDLVAGQRELRDAQRRVSDGGRDEVHLADLALVLLLRRDLLRVGRPERDGAIAAAPAGVVGGVAEVLDAVGGQLPFLPCRDVHHPQVPVADEDAALRVGRDGEWFAVARCRAARRRHVRVRRVRPQAAARTARHHQWSRICCPATSHDHRFAARLKLTVAPSADRSIVWKGRPSSSNFAAAAVDRAAASFA